MNAKRTLLRLMNLSQFEGVMRTSDGFYIAQIPGDIGYNFFLGRPAPVHEGPGLRNTLKIWASLTEDERKAVRRLAANPVVGSPIPLSEFGIPEEGH